MATIVPIERTDDPRLVDYANVRDRDLLQRERFIVEGELVVRGLLTRSLYPVRSLLLEARRVEKMADALEALSPEVPVYVLPQDAMNELVGFPIHRGVLAVAERGAPLSVGALLSGNAKEGSREKPSMLVVPLGLSNHDNVGGIFRSAAAFGIDGVLIDSVTCDPLYRKAVRVSVGGALTVPFARAGSEAEALDALVAHDYRVFALTARGETDILEVAKRPIESRRRCALLLGAEGPGLSPSVLERTERVRIAMRGTLDSLNVSVACGIALHALTSGMP